MASSCYRMIWKVDGSDLRAQFEFSASSRWQFLKKVRHNLYPRKCVQMLPLWSVGILDPILEITKENQCQALTWESSSYSHELSADCQSAPGWRLVKVAKEGYLLPEVLIHWEGLVLLFLIMFFSNKICRKHLENVEKHKEEIHKTQCCYMFYIMCFYCVMFL